jgi:hypothetical protein
MRDVGNFLHIFFYTVEIIEILNRLIHVARSLETFRFPKIV